MRSKLILLSLFCSLFYSCSKEYSCEDCKVVPEDTKLVLACASGYFSLPVTVNTPYVGSCTISYSGGNGLSYNAGNAIPSTGVTGLTATLSAGILAIGNGNLTYTIAGTATTSGNAVFNIDFEGQSCNLSLNVDSCSPITVITSKIRIATEKERCLAVITDGRVKSWGYNAFGQLGDGTTVDRHTPVLVNTISNIAAVAAGAYHSLALGNDGKVWAWGKNDFGQLGDGTIIERHEPLQIAGLSGIVAIAGGYDYSIALKNDGTVWAWGANHWGQLGDGTYTDRLNPVQVINLCRVTAIAGGEVHCLALKDDGTVWAWGWNLNGALGDGSNIDKRSSPVQVATLSGITAITTNGSNHSLALKNDGTVWSWGDNFLGQLGDGTYTAKNIPLRLTTLAGITTIGVGENHSFAVKNDGSLWAWGWNGTGQLGVDDAFIHEPIPVNVNLLPGVTRIVGGNFHSIVEKIDGTIWTMGDNVFGQLGDGTNTIYRYTPMIVNGL